MQAKFFQIPLSECEKAQRSLNLFLDSVTVEKSEVELINAPLPYWSVMILYSEKLAPKTKGDESPQDEKIYYHPDTELFPEEKGKMRMVENWRKRKAEEAGLPPYFILSKAVLVAIVKTPLTKPEDLAQIKGMGKEKIARYGGEILSLLHRSIE